MIKSAEELKQSQAEELKRLIDYLGSQTRLAAILDIQPQVVSNWVARGKISATMATEVERKTSGMFTRKQLRPDVINWHEDV